MKDLDDRLQGLQAQFRHRLREETKPIDMGALEPELFDPGETWYCKPATGMEGQKITAHLNNGKLFDAQIEAIAQRITTDPEGQKKMFQNQKRRDMLRTFDPQFINALISEMGAFEDVVPDVEDAEKNSTSTGTQDPSLSSEKH